MSTIQDIPHPAARLRRTIGAALATLGVVIAIGVGVLLITSVSSSRTVRTLPFHAAPCSEACADGGHPHEQNQAQTGSIHVRHAYGATP